MDVTASTKGYCQVLGSSLGLSKFGCCEKVMRGLKKNDTPIPTGYQVFHNAIRAHEGLNGTTPLEECRIKVEGENKWITLIQNASKN